MRLDLPGQMDMAGTDRRPAALAKARAAAPLMASKPQMPCDVGLFSDDAAQLDLIEMFMDPTE